MNLRNTAHFLYEKSMESFRSYIGDGFPTFNDGNPYNGYINPHYWVDDHALLYGNFRNGSLDPSTYKNEMLRLMEEIQPVWGW